MSETVKIYLNNLKQNKEIIEAKTEKIILLEEYRMLNGYVIDLTSVVDFLLLL